MHCTLTNVIMALKWVTMALEEVELAASLLCLTVSVWPQCSSVVAMKYVVDVVVIILVDCMSVVHDRLSPRPLLMSLPTNVSLCLCCINNYRTTYTANLSEHRHYTLCIHFNCVFNGTHPNMYARTIFSLLSIDRLAGQLV